MDTNILAYLYLPGEFTADAEALLEREPEWAAPPLWRSELRNILLGCVRRHMLSFEQAFSLQAEAESLMEGFEFDVHSREVMALARDSDCSACDCEFVALAELLDARLVTMDKKVLTFGKSETEVKLFDLQAAGATPEQLAKARELLGVLEQRKRAQEDLQVAAQVAAQSQQLLNETLSEVGNLVSANQALRDEVDLIGKSAEERAALEQARIASAIAAKEEALAMAQVAQASAVEIQALEQQIALLKQRSALVGQRGIAEQAAEDAQKVKEFAQQVGASFQSAFENAVIEGEKFRDVLKGIAKDLLRLIIRNQITGPLAQAIGGVDFGSLFTARANGGPVFAGDGYLVGERGPELFVPNTAGRVLPTEALRGGGRQEVNIQVVNNTGVQASARQETSPDGGIRLILDAVAGDISAGGRVAGAMSSTFGLNRGAGTPRRTR